MSTTLHIAFTVAAFLVILIIASACATQALAHNPIFARGNNDFARAARIPDANVSYAMYGYLSAPGEAHFYYVDISSPVSLMTQILVPKNEVYATFRPSYAIMGPGITESHPLPFDVPAGNGSRLINPSRQAPGKVFHEPFSGITYDMSSKTYTSITVPGRYYMAIFDEDRKKGDYVLATGEVESFKAREIPGTIWKVIELRLGRLDHSKEASGP